LQRQIRWRAAESTVSAWAARIDECWWVLRLNSFPDHPRYTLFIDGHAIGDIDDLPASWQATRATAGSLTVQEGDQVLAVMSGLGPYGSEAGTPCEGDWCACSVLTDDYASLTPGPQGSDSPNRYGTGGEASSSRTADGGGCSAW